MSLQYLNEPSSFPQAFWGNVSQPNNLNIHCRSVRSKKISVTGLSLFWCSCVLWKRWRKAKCRSLADKSLRTFLWSPSKIPVHITGLCGLVVRYKTSGLSGSHAAWCDRDQNTCCLVADDGKWMYLPGGWAFALFTSHEMVPKAEAKGN